MSLLDLITGGKSTDAADAMRKAEEAYSSLNVPTAAQLALPELQQYVQAGLMTPAQATAVLQGSNAYDTTTVPTAGRDAELSALNQLQDIASAKGMDATEQASVQDAINKMNTATSGQRGAILDSFAQRGVPLSLASLVASNQVAGQNAEQANSSALQANADAQMRAIQAMQGAGTLGSTIQGQDWTQANAKAAAQNAINQWNSQVATNVAQSNAANKQAANAYNTQTGQNVSDANVGNANARTQYNAQVPQTIYQDAATKAAGESGAFTNAANLAQKQGQQTAGIYSGLLGAGATALTGNPLAGAAVTTATGPATSGGMQANGGTWNPNIGEGQLPGYSKGGIVGCYDEGGMVPGRATVTGDSPANDTVTARLSPGELVVPRSLVHQFIQHMPPKKPAVHPDDITNVFHALTNMRHAAPMTAAARG